jgi:hypothetical protein
LRIAKSARRKEREIKKKQSERGDKKDEIKKCRFFASNIK